MIERREFRRVKEEINIQIKKVDSIEYKYTRSIDISGGGILINYKEKLEKDSLVKVKFLKPNSFDFFEGLAKIVRIEKDAFVGTNVTVHPGVTIGEGAVIGSNSLVLKDVEPWTINIGSPCKPIGQRPKVKFKDL